MTRRVILGVVLSQLMVATVAAQTVSSVQFFPGAARAAGLPPSRWVTDIAVNNLNGSQITVGFQFLPAGVSHTFMDLTFPVRRTLPARRTALYEDVVTTLFGYNQDVIGAVLVTCENDLLGISSNPEEAVILATARTYDVSSPVGTYGQTIPNNEFVMNATQWQSFITGARNDADFRSNLGIINLSMVEVDVHYRFLRGDASVIAQGFKTMGSLSIRQWSFNSLGVGTVEGPITVDLWLDPSDVNPDPCDPPIEGFPNSFMAYVSKGDRNSQDPEFMYAAPSVLIDCED